jgi:hypothetical protein
MQGMDRTTGAAVVSMLVVAALLACGSAPTAVPSRPSSAAAMPPSAAATVAASTPPSALATVAAGPSNGKGGGAATFDWENITVPGDACLSREPIELVNGTALIPDDQRGHPVGGSGPKYDRLSELGQPTFGDFEGQTSTAIAVDAAIGLDCNNNWGMASGALLESIAVFSVSSGAQRFVGLITPHQQTAGTLPTGLSVVAMTPGLITVTEDWYGPDDHTCCPTGKAQTTWR